MKRLFFAALFACCTLCLTAQSTATDTLAVDSMPTALLTPHILFEGVELKGDIYDFSAAMQKRGFSLSKRLGNDNAYIFQGTVCGHTCYTQVSYTRHSRTVYKIMVQPKHVDLNVYLDSICARYGQVYDQTERGYQWMLPNGAVMLFTPDGYDPTLVVMDAEGVAAFKEENDRPRMR